MDSSKDDGNAPKAFPALSPSAQAKGSKSPFSKFLSDLSPINSARASQYTQRLSESSFPTTPSVFGSPRLDLQQETSFLKRDEIAASSSSAHGQCYSTSNSAVIPCIQKQLQSCSRAEGVDEYLADHLEVENAQPAETYVQSDTDVPRLLPNLTVAELTTAKVNDINDGIVEVEAHNLPHLTKRKLLPGSLSLVEVSGDQSKGERFDKMLEFSSENLGDHVVQEASQHQRDIRRHLQFEAAVDCKRDATHFGLHLSNVTRSLTVDSDVISSNKLTGYQSTQEKHIPGRSNSLLENTNDPLISTGREVIDLVDSDDQSSEAVVVASGDNLLNNNEPPWDSQQVSYFHQQTLPCDGKIPQQFAETERVEELSQCQDSSKGKRKRETYTDESEGCKRCNCKRSKCLKLYCECFAAGIYCVDSCACENCYNKPDYEDTVSVVREQIELRNPLAFAPTIVKQANDSPNVADNGNWMTPSSARHKSGCKCKRSKCLKKYCECYRAKVGCSDGCHCEGCDNSFGKKSELKFQRAENQKNLSQEKLNTADLMSDRVIGGTSNQFSPTWEELVNISHLTTLSHPHSRAVPSLTSPNMGDSPNVSQTLAQKGSGLQLSPGHLHWCSSDLSPTQACVSKFPHELSSISAVSDIMEDGSPDMLKDNSNPTNTLKSGSPKQKRVSSPQFQSARLGSSSISGLLSGRKLILQSVPSFPSLTPYCNSEDRMNQTENDHQGSQP